MFMTSALEIGVPLGVATRSRPAVSRLVDVNRSIVTQLLPALRMGTSLREQRGGLLVRLPRDVAPRVGAASAGGER